MSKQIKQMEMDALKQIFAEVRDLVVMSATGIDAQADNQLRHALRKKDIHLQIVKNSLARQVFDNLGIKLDGESRYWKGPSLMAWGSGSLAELSQGLDSAIKDLVKKNAKLKDKVTFKGAVAEGQQITFEQALKMPTRAQAVGRVVGLALAPASRLVSQILAPAGRVASQIKTISEKPAEAAAASAPA
jgi:large subunit ribosomal protein L10